MRRSARPRTVALVAACAAIDAIAAGMLLLDPPLPRGLEGLAAAVLHLTAALLISAAPRGQPSRRWLCVAAVLAVPGVGVLVAAAVLGTRGRGSAATWRRRQAPVRPALTIAAARRLGDALPACDALVCGDEEERRAALWALARRADPEAIALLRWAAASRDADLAQAAALALDEIGERAERRLVAPSDAAELRHAAG